jgi:hypothetical protein
MVAKKRHLQPQPIELLCKIIVRWCLLLFVE